MKLLGLIGFLLLTSCATKVTGLQQSEEFNYANIKSGRIAIGGVTSVTDEVSTKQNLSYSNMWKNEIVEEHSDLPVVPAGAVYKKLGKKDYEQLMEDFSLTGSFGEAMIQKLSTKAKVARFIAFAKIDTNEELTHHNENEAQDSQGNVIKGRTDIVASSERKMTVAIQVVDLARSNVAWSGSITKSATAQKNYTKKDDSSLVTVVKVLAGSDDAVEKQFPAPKAPSADAVLKNIFAGFVSNLPEED